MSIRPHLKTLACCVGAALVQMAAGAALADSGVGVDTILGNAMNPSPDATRPLDPNGLGPFRQPAAHTPTGQLYNIPYALPEVKKSESGWEYSGHVEFGVLGGDANDPNAQFRAYKDLGNGAYLNNFGFQADKPDEARYVEILGGGVGKRDQYYGLQFGRYNDWRVRTFYSESPHVFTSTFGTLWSGVGTGNLTLLPPLTPGGTGTTAAARTTDNTNVKNVSDANNMTLMVTRKKGGVRFDLNLTDSWKGYASYTLEKREGARPFGAVWGAGGGTSPIEVPEPVDNKTHDIFAGLQYTDALNALNLRFSASMFRNNNDTLTFQEPYTLFAAATNGIAPGGFTRGRIDLVPNNESYNARAEYARALPDFYKGRFTSVVSLGTMRQNDSLIPYSITPGVTLANVAGNNWDTTASLSRQTADTRIDTALVDLGLAVNPTDALNLKGKFRFYQNDNKSKPFLTCNPNATYLDADPVTAGAQPGTLTKDGCSGVWGRVLNDGTGSYMLLSPAANALSNVSMPIKSIPFEYKQYNIGLAGDYRLNNVSNLNAAYEREIFHREHRERNKTWEDKAKLSYVNRGLPNSTVRLSYEYGDRRGDSYNPDPYEEFMSTAIISASTAVAAGITDLRALVHTNNGFRKHDLADRKQHILNGRFNTMLRSDLDAGVAAQMKEIDFPDSPYGREKQSQKALNFDLNYQPSAGRSIFGFYTFQNNRTNQRSIVSSGVACTVGTVTPSGTITVANAADICGAPGGQIYPLANTWALANADRNHVFGVGWHEDFGRARLNLNFTRAMGRSEVHYSYKVQDPTAVTPAATGAITPAVAPFAGGGMPDITIFQNIFDASLVVPYSRQVAVRLLYRYENGRIADWHYHGLDASPIAAATIAVLPTAVVLDSGPQNFHASVFGILLQIRM